MWRWADSFSAFPLSHFIFTHSLACTPQSGNKTKPISESQNNTETIFSCGCLAACLLVAGSAHKFTQSNRTQFCHLFSLWPLWFGIAFHSMTHNNHFSSWPMALRDSTHHTLTCAPHLIFYEIPQPSQNHFRCKRIKRHSDGLFDVISMRVNL